MANLKMIYESRAELDRQSYYVMETNIKDN